MTRSHALRNDQWERIKDILSGQPGDVGVIATDNRLFIEAVLYRYKAGKLWRDLPKRFGEFKVVDTRFTRWSIKGVWEQFLMSYLSNQMMNTRC
ncbi:Putative transposase of IS4/5 family [Psychrobacter sp. LV10R520-6]|nr:Putative transposase of IS4/5 family [Psychrobacter sp. LV10R520-6]